MSGDWHDACATGDIDDEDLITLKVAGEYVAIYNTPEGFFVTHAMCTHEEEPLGDGLVMDGVIECPLHQGRFCVRTGKALSAPATVDLKTYKSKVENGRVFIQIGGLHYA